MANRLIDRFIIYIKSKDISNSNAEKSLGVSNGYIRNAEIRPNGEVNSSFLSKVSKVFLDINLLWLINGEGEMLNNPVGSHNYIAYTPASTSLKSVVSEPILFQNAPPTLPNFAPPTAPPTPNFGLPSVVTVAEDGKELVPFVPVKAAAGYLNKYADESYIQALPAMRLHGFRNGTYRAFEVEGHSMLPTIHNGSIAVGEWVESIQDIRDRRIYIIITDGGIVIKRVVNRLNSDNRLILISDNANKVEYPNSHVTAEQIKEVWYLRGALQFTFTEPSEIHGRINELEGKVSILYDLYKQQKG